MIDGRREGQWHSIRTSSKSAGKEEKITYLPACLPFFFPHYSFPSSPTPSREGDHHIREQQNHLAFLVLRTALHYAPLRRTTSR